MATSVLEVLIAGDSSGLTKALAQGAASAEAFQKGMATTGAKAQSSLTSVSTSLKALAPAFIAVGGAAVAAIAKGISGTQQWASDTRSLQRVTGQTAESASSLLGAANLLGLSVSSLSTGFGILSKNIINGSTGLTKYGIATRDAQGQTLPFDSVLGNVIDKFQTLQPGAEQTAFAMNVFGRSGKDLIPILSKGRDGMAELEQKAADLGLVMSQDDVNASKALTLAQHELGLAFKGAEISIGELFIPALTKVVNVASNAVQVITRLPAPVKEVGLGVALAAGAVGTLTLAFQGLSKVFSPVISGLNSLGQALLESGLLQNAAAALSATASGVEIVGTEAAKSGQQLSLFGDQGSNALTNIQAGANAATIAVEAGTAKQAGLFEGLATKIAGVGSSIVGFFGEIGTGIAAALSGAGEVIVIVTAIAAAVALATVVIVKNWDKVGAAFAVVDRFLSPLIDSVKNAFSQVLAAANQLGAALGDAFSAVGQALQPLLPIITPILSILGKALGLIVAAPFIAALDLLVITLKGVALGLRVAADVVEFFANAVIAGTNGVISAINSVIGASNRFLHTNFQTIDSIDKVSLSTDGLTTSLTPVAPAIEQASGSMTGLGKAVNGVRPLLQAMGTSFKTLKDGAVSAFTQAQQSGSDTTAALQSYADQQIAAAQKARQAFQSQAQGALTFTTSMLSSLEQAAQSASDTLAGDTSNLSSNALAALRDQAHITASDILSTFRAAGAQSKSFGHDLLELARIGGQAGKDLASALLTSGDVLSAQVIADAPAKMQKQIVSAFGKSQSAADSFSTKLTDAIVGPLKTIEDLLVQLARKAFHVKLNYGSVTKADTAVANLNQSILNLPTHTVLDIKTHVHGSDLPDEVLRKHLFDPLARGGFKKINGTWTLPLNVGVHGELDNLSNLWKRQAEDAATSIVALTNRSGSTPKEGVGIVRHVAQAGSDAAYIKSVAAGVGKELNAAQAQHFERALQLLDKRTIEGGARSDAAIQAALGKMSHLLDQNQQANRQWMTDALAYATHNVPRLPEGHTNISVNHHERHRHEVVLDRRRFADAAAYDIDYARGF